jgi:CRP-like cAMP-binding protein
MAPMADMLDYCSDLPVLSVPEGDVLIMEGGQPSQMFVLVSGSVTIEKDLVPFARIDHSGAVFGEMSWVLDRSATATVRAATPVEVRVIDGLTQYLVDVKQQFAGLTGHLGMVDQILDSLVHHQSGPTKTGSVRDPEC